jgi:excisionase family DNA binding protein
VPKNLDQQLLKVPEVAERLGVGRRTVLSYIHSGALSAINISSAKLPHYRVSESDLAAFVEARRVTP